MKINRINLRHVRMTLQTPFETSFGRIYTRDCVLIEARSGSLTGFGECVADKEPGYSYETSATAWHILSDFLAPAIIGQDIESPIALPSLTNFVRGHSMAKAGLEMAIWDLFGKVQEKSLKELLGGSRKKVSVGVSIGIQNSPKELLEIVEHYLDLGYLRVKIKIKPGRDVMDTKAVRTEFPSLDMQVDANSAYSLETAAPLYQLDDLRLLMIEQPLSEDDLWDHKRLQAQLKTPICLDESIVSPRHARQAIEMDSCRVINIKVGRVGGLGQAHIIHDICQEEGIPVWCGGMLETGVGRAANLALASLPNFIYPGDISATNRYYAEDITHECFVLNKDSTIDVPDGPGLGISINWKALEKVTIDKIMIQP